MDLATASRTSILLISSSLSFESVTKLKVIALAVRTSSTVTNPLSPSSAMFAARSRSSMAILASPYSADAMAICLRESSGQESGIKASSARACTMSNSSSSV